VGVARFLWIARSLRQLHCLLETLVLWRESVMQNLDAALACRGVAASRLVDERVAYLAPRGEECSGSPLASTLPP
jgi:hypothetical protein